MNELKDTLRIQLSCDKCGLTKTITVNLDANGVFTIPNKFCPNDLTELKREVLRQFVSEPKPIMGPISDVVPIIETEIRTNEPTEDKARTSNAVSKPARPVDVPKHGANSSKKA